jgi:hypothetical protein
VLGIEGLVEEVGIRIPEHPEQLLSPPAPRITDTGESL